MTARAQWEAMSEQGQLKMIIGCIVTAARTNHMSVNPLDHVGDTYIRLIEKLDQDRDLPLIVTRAAGAALQKAHWQDKKFADADNYEIKSADGESLGGILELIAGAGSVENEVVTRIDFGRFYKQLDGINKQIVNGLAVGLVRREIASTVNMTTTAVTMRVHKMRETLRQCMA